MAVEQGRGRATMKQVAALAGVSLKTVSRVVNGEPFVSPAVISRVQDAAQRLNYRPNLTASSLRRADGRTRTVGLLLENVANPFSAALHRAIEDVARERGVVVLAGSVDEDPVRERELVTAFSNRRVDGLIVVPSGGDQSYLAAERSAGTALVFVDRPPQFLDADVVLVANRAGAEAATTHLIERGHRRIAFLGDNPDIYTAAERFAGYTDALAHAAIPVDEAIVRRGLHSSDASLQAQLDLMSTAHPPTAVFTGQNLITVGAIKALRQLGRHRTTALVGFDDMALAELLDPGVTVVAQDTNAMGALAAELLFRRIDGDERPTERCVLATRIVTRGSGELRPT